MTAEFDPPTLADMCGTFWGPDWRGCLAKTLYATEADVRAWETEPATRPANLVDNVKLNRSPCCCLKSFFSSSRSDVLFAVSWGPQ